MKKLQIKFFMVALAFATILVGCKPEPIEQSSVNINDFKETATITGTLQYDEGQGFDGTKYTRLVKPAADVTVTAVIANSEYSATTTGSGNITYNTKTDTNGNYSITVPVTSKGVNVRIKATNFTGQYHRIIDVKNGAPVYKDIDGVYTLDERTFKLEPNDFEIFDGIFSFDNRENAEEYAHHSEYKVIVGKAAYSKTIDEETSIPKVVKQYREAEDVDVIIKVEHNGESFTYVSSTDNEGVATFYIPTHTLTWDPTIYVTANKFSSEKFTYYRVEWDNENNVYVTKTYKLSGFFKQVNGTIDYPEFSSIESMPTPEHRIKMDFYTFENEEDFGHNGEYWGDIEF